MASRIPSPTSSTLPPGPTRMVMGTWWILKARVISGPGGGRRRKAEEGVGSWGSPGRGPSPQRRPARDGDLPRLRIVVEGHLHGIDQAGPREARAAELLERGGPAAGARAEHEKPAT